MSPDRKRNLLLFAAVVSLGALCIEVRETVANQLSRKSGTASVYGVSSGPKTASGERLREDSLTAAHPSLPFGTIVEVTNNRNGQKTKVRINDRGPFVRGRVIDVTPAAASALGFSGLTEVSLTVVSAPEQAR
jgi:peptidoglycan lytic transglycosylase